MKLSSLKLQQVRRHSEIELEFSTGVNILLGPNTCGKTTILEALGLIATGRSYLARTKDLIQVGSDWLRIDANFSGHQRSVKLALAKSSRPAFIIDNSNYSRLKRDQMVPLVWFNPHQTNLLNSSPSKRRDLIDGLLSQLEPGYLDNLRRYQRSLIQRNNLLKQPQTTPKSLFVWNLRLAEHGSQIVTSRQLLLNKINTQLQPTYQKLSNDRQRLTVQYLCQLDPSNYGDKLLHHLQDNCSQEVAAGHTLYGPHRDDWQITNNQHNINQIASRGEMRSIILAIKLIETNLLTAAFQSPPLLLLDDVFSELDGARRKAVVTALSKSQAFITTTDADIVHKDFSQKARLITL